MSLEFADRFAGLNEKRLVIFQVAQRAHHGVETFPISRRSSGAAINDQSVRRLRDFRIEIVHKHAHGGFLVPTFASGFCSAWSPNGSFPAHKFSCSSSNSPARIAAAIALISEESTRSCNNGAAYFRTVA